MLPTQFGLKTISLLCLLSFLSGCATIISSKKQEIHVQAVDSETLKPIPTAKCSLTNSKGVTYFLSSNPGSIVIPRLNGGLQANCIAEGYHLTKISANEKFNPMVLADLALWPAADLAAKTKKKDSYIGAAVAIPAIVMDTASGAAFKYPSQITVMMKQKA